MRYVTRCARVGSVWRGGAGKVGEQLAACQHDAVVVEKLLASACQKG
jgi:hypothetical protein